VVQALVWLPVGPAGEGCWPGLLQALLLLLLLLALVLLLRQ
jgi:hypothetical protein